jgi:hypothetical protein
VEVSNRTEWREKVKEQGGHKISWGEKRIGEKRKENQQTSEDTARPYFSHHPRHWLHLQQVPTQL